MAKTTTKLLGLALAGAAAYGAWTVGQGLLGDDDEAQGTQHVLNQFWIERMPDGPRDMVGHLIMIDVPDGRFGAAGKSSQWRHFVEIFQYGLEGHRLSVFFPQDKVKGQLKVRSWRCDGEAPPPFELCLEINNGRRTTVFYSLDEWRVDPDRVGESLDEIREANPEVAELLPAVSMPVHIEAEALEGYRDVDGALPLLGE